MFKKMFKKLFILVIMISLLAVSLTGCDTFSGLRKSKELAIEITLINGPPKSYNQYITKIDSIYYPLDKIWIYIDIKNLSFEMKENEMLGKLGRWINAEQKLEVYGPNGNLFLEQFMFYEEGFLYLDFNLDETYLVNYFMVPFKPYIGEYKIVITMWDHLKETIAVDSVNFIVKSDDETSLTKKSI